MTINRKTIIRWKIYFDRARMYVSYIQFLLIGLVFIKQFKGGISNYFMHHVIWTIPLMIMIFVLCCLVIGYLDHRLGIRAEEYNALSEANPMMIEIRNRLRGEDLRMALIRHEATIEILSFSFQREILGLTIRQVASLTGLSSSTISRIERGRDCLESSINKLKQFYDEQFKNRKTGGADPATDLFSSIRNPDGESGSGSESPDQKSPEIRKDGEADQEIHDEKIQDQDHR
jgi:transcriptional regulator with XRE-family HTH domain